MPTIEELRRVWSNSSHLSDDLLLSPWFHVGVIRSGVAGKERLKLSIDVIADALSAAEDTKRS